MGVLPDFGLIGTDPVGFGFLLQIGNRFAEPGHFENKAPQATDRPQSVGFALIQPHNRRTQRVAVCIDVHHASSLGGQGDCSEAVFIDMVMVPDSLAGLNQCFPEYRRMLFGPGRMF